MNKLKEPLSFWETVEAVVVGVGISLVITSVLSVGLDLSLRWLSK